MTVSDLMTENPTTIQQDCTLRHALETLDRVGCHHLPVIHPHGTRVGVLTSHDCRQALNLPSVLHRHSQEHLLLDRVPVSAVMTLMPVVVQEHTPAEDAVQLMLDQHIGCLPIMWDNALVASVTTSDILRACAKLLRKLPKLSLGKPEYSNWRDPNG